MRFGEVLNCLKEFTTIWFTLKDAPDKVIEGTVLYYMDSYDGKADEKGYEMVIAGPMGETYDAEDVHKVIATRFGDEELEALKESREDWKRREMLVTKRININMPVPTLKKIDAYAERMNINRTAAIIVALNTVLEEI